ncbi:MAG: choice-of-anchor Q domain-containing protein [bacterium]
MLESAPLTHQKNHRRPPSRAVAVLFGLLLSTAVSTGSRAATITVSTENDEWNTGAGCSLREAIEAANTDSAFGGCTAGSGDDVISVPAGTYALTLAGAGEDANATGDLDLSSNIELQGAGRTLTVLDGGDLDRVLHILPGATVQLRGLTVRNGNVAGDGGGILSLSVATLEDVAVHNNVATGNGGGIRATLSLTLLRCDIRGNEARDAGAAGGGGGIYAVSTTLRIERSLLFDNLSAVSVGGGLLAVTSTVTLLNSTISGNSAAWHGGGIYSSFSSLSISHCTIAWNVGDLGDNGAVGGGVRISSGTAAVKNTILAGNQVIRGASGSHDCASTVVISSAGYNLIQTPGTICPGFGSADFVGVDPLLGVLEDNGGETLTHPLLSGSPARNTGTCLDLTSTAVLTDQRGAPRPNAGVCDIGAFEWMWLHRIDATQEPNGPNCAYGGHRLDVGDDVDFSGSLDATEVESTAYLCNDAPPVDGVNSLVRIDPVPVGDATCAEGGQLVLSGLDDGAGGGTAHDGVLHDDEVDAPPVWLCSGSDGLDGSNALIRVNALPVGDASCVNGGQEILIGLDNGDGNGIAGDGALHDDEVDEAPAVVCYGLDGAPGQDGASGLIRLETLSVGDATCPEGGQLLSFGLDDGDGLGSPGDGVLHDDEVDAPPVAVCNGGDGINSLVRVESVPVGDANCQEGGQRILTGMDDGDGAGTAGDGVLHDDEADGPIQYVCHGDSGVVAHLLRVDPIAVGDAQCPAGGQLVQGGLDNGDGGGIAGDGILQNGEVDSQPAILCNGNTGDTGQGGAEALIQSTALQTGDASPCPDGGERIEVGVDEDRDGLLDPEEVDEVFFVCHGDEGASGANGLMTVTPLEPGDEHCEFGGQQVDTGLDGNGDGTLSQDELEDRFYVCNGGNVPVDIEGGGGCSTGGRTSGGAGLIPLLLIWVWRRRRRRQ